MKLTMTAAATAVLAVCATSATAATFDFENYGEDFQESQQYEGTFDQVADWLDDGAVDGSTNAIEVDGISVTAEGFKDATPSLSFSDDYYQGPTLDSATPFFDSISGGKLAGLGVCSSGDSTQQGPGGVTVSACSTGFDPSSANSDDNLNMTEYLVLTFNTEVMIEELFVRDAGHFFLKESDGDSIMIGTDGMSSLTSYYAEGEEGSIDLAGLGSSSIFWFSASEQSEAYISTLVASVPQIPLPAGAWLMLGALGGLGAAARRKRG